MLPEIGIAPAGRTGTGTALDRRAAFGYGPQVSVRVHSYHLPGIEGHIPSEPLRCGAVEVEVPRLGPDQFRSLLDRARAAALQHLRRRPVDEILAAVDCVVANWLRPDYHLRQQAEEILPLATGFSPSPTHLSTKRWMTLNTPGR